MASQSQDCTDSDWQTQCKGVSSRLGELLKRGVWGDVEFSVGPGGERIASHSVLLAAASPVFAAMLHGPLCQGQPVVVPDMEPDIFKLMLKYIYTDKIEISSCDIACSLYYGAQKYILPHLMSVCTEYLLSNVAPQCVFRVYELAKLFEETKLMDKCLKMMQEKTGEVLAEGHLEEALAETLELLLSQKILNVSEMDLLLAVQRYARAHCPALNTNTTIECKQEDVDPGPGGDGDNKLIIRKFLEKIRFLDIDPKEFAEHDLSSILTESDILAIALNMLSSKTYKPMPKGFTSTRESRVKLEPQTSTIKLLFDKYEMEIVEESVDDHNMHWTLICYCNEDDQTFNIELRCKSKRLRYAWSCQASIQLEIISNKNRSYCEFKHLFQGVAENKYADKYHLKEMDWDEIFHSSLRSTIVHVEVRIDAQPPTLKRYT